MRTLKSVLLGGFAALALAGSTALAADKTTSAHEMTIRLPGGAIEHIQYTGDVAPRVVVQPAPLDEAWPNAAMFWSTPSFAALERFSAEMNRQLDVLFRQAQALALAPLPGSGGVTETALHNLPPGTSSYMFTSTFTGRGICMQSVQVTAPASGGKPQVVSSKSGDCESRSDSAGPIGAHQPSLQSGVTPIKLPKASGARNVSTSL
jgi:hypothetical protein